MTDPDRLAALLHLSGIGCVYGRTGLTCGPTDDRLPRPHHVSHAARLIAAGVTLARSDTAALDVERPTERPVVADRCVCSHKWVDHTTWCDSSGCPCRFTADTPARADTAVLDVERLEQAIRNTFGGTPPTAHGQAADIAREYAALEATK